jgi:hypothetical protein
MKRYRFYVGSKTEANVPVTYAQWGVVDNLLVRIFNGFTRYEVHGGWQDRLGNIIYEPAYCYECISDGIIRDAAIAEIARNIRMETLQASVLYTIEDIQGGFV